MIKKNYLWGILSFVFCMSFFMSIFTPLPLTYLMLDRDDSSKKALWGGLGAFFLLTFFVLNSPGVFGVYCFFFAIAAVFSWCIKSDINPKKMFLTIAGTGYLVFWILCYSTLFVKNMSLTQYVENNIQTVGKEILSQKVKLVEEQGDKGRELIDFFSNSRESSKKVISVVFSLSFIIFSLFIWLNLFIILKNLSILKVKYSYPLNNLLELKLPEFFIWPSILALSLFLFGENLGPLWPVIGKNVIFLLAFFYFLQGVGIYVQFLDFLRIYGIFKGFLLMIAIFMGYWVLALVGFFDVWINFNRFMKDKRT